MIGFKNELAELYTAYKHVYLKAEGRKRDHLKDLATNWKTILEKAKHDWSNLGCIKKENLMETNAFSTEREGFCILCMRYFILA